MIKKIFISYSKSESVNFCFWKYFFYACGIWTKEQEISKNWKKDPLEIPHLLILGNEDVGKISSHEEANCVYLVKKSSAFRKNQYRKDIFRLDRWENNKIFLQTVRGLLTGFGECMQIQELLIIFKDENLWGASWLFNEFAYQEKGRWDDKISEISKRVLKILRMKRYNESWYYNFMRLYCWYIYCGAFDRSFQKRVVECERILERCKEMARIYGWVPALSLIAAQTCGLVETEEKYAVSFYRSVLKHEQDAEIFYKIGYVYEKKYLEKGIAYEYYRRAYHEDPNHYRVLYKIAAFFEEQGKWMPALEFYNRIRNMLKGKNMQCNIYVREIEYYYKACRKIMMICSQNINDDGLVESYSQEIEEIQENIRNNSFSQLIHCMFGKQFEKQILEEISEEVLEKIQKGCNNQ